MRLGRILQVGFAAVALILSAVAVAAQTITVQSGEHAGFTRLVLDIGVDREWTLTGEGETRRLALDPPVEGFAIARVFDLIPRTRLSALAEEDGLRLWLACACAINASRHQGRYLVLDIAEPDPARAAPTPAPEDAAASVRRQAAAESLPDMTRLLAGSAPPQSPVRRPDTTPPQPPARGDIDMAEAARIMSEQLARAAASGLLEAAPGRPMSDADAVPGVAPEPPRPDLETAGDPVSPYAVEPPGPGAPLRAETALDAALHRALRAEPQGNQLACTGALLSIRDWAAGDTVHHGLGALRLALYDVRDQLRRDAVLALARHYLAFGFGAEAAFWLTQIENAPPDLAVIAALVDGVEGAHFLPEPDPLICSEEELLWRYLDGALGAHALTEEEAGRLQRATAALPTALRDEIAPRVARRLQVDGHPSAARNLRDLLLRGGRLSGAAMVQLDLDLGIARPGDARTGAALALALRDDGADPVGAMAHALGFDREIGLPPDETRLHAAEALLREHGLGPETAALWQEVVLAHAANGSLDRMVVMLAEARNMPEDRRNATLTSLFSDRLAAQDTAALFVLARLHGAEWVAEGSVAGRARVGTMVHLREAGLADAAEVLRAGQRPVILPARPGVAPDPTERLRAAWQRGDWTRLSGAAEGPHRQIALRMLTRDADASDPSAVAAELPDLPSLAARVADSRDLRTQVATLLAVPAPQQAGSRE